MGFPEQPSLALLTAGHGGPRRILDLPCGHGRVLRVLKAAFPDAELIASDIDPDAIETWSRASTRLARSGGVVESVPKQSNLEVKARDPDPDLTLDRARKLGAEDRGRFFQRDTFFGVPAGRLKLREQDEGAKLIHYVREDRAEPRTSVYAIAPLEDPATVKDVLAAALGIEVVVEKHRRLLVQDNVRIHLDEVKGLGSFVEIEAVVRAGASSEGEAERVDRLMLALGITDDRLVGGAYADEL